MAWTSPRTWVALETVTAALLNTHVRDNLNALMIVTTKGDIAVATASVTLTRLAVGSDGAVLVADSVATPGVRWSSTGKTAAAGGANNLVISNTLTAIANNDIFHNFLAYNVVAKGTFTGLTYYALTIAAASATATGTGTIANAYGLYITPPTIGTANAALYVSSGFCGIGDDANAKMTTGLTINQGAADNEILALKSSDVAHGMTTQTETDTYFLITKQGALTGGANLRGFTSGAGYGINVLGIVTTDDTTKSNFGYGSVDISGAKKDGTTFGLQGANANLVSIGNQGTTRFILDSDGDSHQDVGTAWTNFDEQDDIALLNMLAAHVTRKDDPLRRNFGRWLREKRKRLEELKLVTFNRGGHHFVNMSRLTMLHTGALRALGVKLDAQAVRLLQLEQKVLQLSA